MTIYRADGSLSLTTDLLVENDMSLLKGEPSFERSIEITPESFIGVFLGKGFEYLRQPIERGEIQAVTHPLISQTCWEKKMLYDIGGCSLILRTYPNEIPESEKWTTSDMLKALYLLDDDGKIYIIVAGGSPPEAEADDHGDYQVDINCLRSAYLGPFSFDSAKELRNRLCLYPMDMEPPLGTSVRGAYGPIIPHEFYQSGQGCSQILTQDVVGAAFIDKRILGFTERGYRLIHHDRPIYLHRQFNRRFAEEVLSQLRVTTDGSSANLINFLRDMPEYFPPDMPRDIPSDIPPDKVKEERKKDRKRRRKQRRQEIQLVEMDRFPQDIDGGTVKLKDLKVDYGYWLLDVHGAVFQKDGTPYNIGNGTRPFSERYSAIDRFPLNERDLVIRVFASRKPTNLLDISISSNILRFPEGTYVNSELAYDREQGLQQIIEGMPVDVSIENGVAVVNGPLSGRFCSPEIADDDSWGRVLVKSSVLQPTQVSLLVDSSIIPIALRHVLGKEVYEIDIHQDLKR